MALPDAQLAGLPLPASPPAPLTRSQSAFWALEQLSPDSGVANLDLVFRTARPLRWWPLHVAANRLVARHPALRLRFPQVNGVPVAHLTAAADAGLTVDMIAATPETLTARLAGYARTPFDLARDFPLRVGCFSLPGAGSVVCVVVHHISSDVVSQQTLLEELCRIYDGVADRNEIPAELGAEAPTLATAEPDPETVRYWVEHLRGVEPAAMALSGARQLPPRPSFSGRTHRHQLSAAGLAALGRLRGELRVTDNITLLSAFYLTLLRHGAGPDLVVGVPVRTRPPDQRDRVGVGISTMALRVRADPRSGFRELVRRTRDSFLAGVAHAEASIEDVLAALGDRSSDWRAPVFRHLYNYRAWDVGHLTVGGAPVELVPLDDRSRLDLDFVAVPQRDGVLLRLTYATEVHREEDVVAFAARLDALLVRVAGDPDRPLCELDAHTEADRRVLAGINATARAWSGPPTVPAMVARVARTAPSGDAVVDGGRVTGYGQLLAWAAAVRDDLAHRGVGRGHVVALAQGRGAGLVAAVLGIWAAGATYLPLDPQHPSDRLAFQVADAGTRLVLVAAGDGAAPAWAQGRAVAAVPAAPEGRSGGADLAAPDPDDPAYLIYTSGTTGRPKGVLVAHRSLANLVRHFAGLLAVDASQAVLWSTTPAFDISMLELFLPLCAGGRLVVADDDTQMSPRQLLDLVKVSDVSLLQATPTAWRLITAEAGDELAGRTVLCGGEPLPEALARRLLGLGCRLFNVYGPTETTIWSTVEPIEADPPDPVPIGRPIANTTIFVTDRYGAEAPPGVVGELCIGGSGVSLGYLGRDELTAERFGEHQRWGRFYRTGDLARVGWDGRLELLGRTDRQVKLRGHRIELPEVESVLYEHGDVRAAAVILDGDPQAEDGQLLAFVQPSSAADAQLVPRLYAHALARLPHYAVPARLEIVDTIPTTPNGKVDYRRLAQLGAARPPVRIDAPRAGQEEPDAGLAAALLGLWRRTLGRADLAAGDNFFSNGGHSLLALRMVPQVAELAGVPVSVRAVFDHPTVRELAAHLTASPGDGGR